MSTVMAEGWMAHGAGVDRELAIWTLATTMACGLALLYVAWRMPAHAWPAVLALVGVAAVLLAILRAPAWGAWLCLLLVYWNASNIIHNRLHFAWTLRGLLIWSWLAWLLHRWLRRHREPLRWPLWRPMLALGTAQALSAYFATYPLVAAASLFGLLKDMALFYLIVNLLPRPRDWHRGIWALLAAGALMSLPVLFQGLSGSHFSFWGLAPLKLAGIYGQRMGYRAGGSLGDPNFFAMALSALLPLAAAEGQQARSLPHRLLAWGTFAVICGAVVLTYSRASFLGLLFVGLAFLYRFRWQPRAWGIAVTALLLAMLAAPSSYWQRIVSLRQVTGVTSMNNLRDPSLAARRNEILVGWAMLKAHPLLGVGPGNYYEDFQHYEARAGWMAQRHRHEVHNLFLEMLTETGVMGMAAFLYFLASIFGLLRSSLRRLNGLGARRFSMLLWGVGAAVTTYLFLSLFLHDAYFRHFFVLIALAGLAGQLVREAAPAAAARRPAL